MERLVVSHFFKMDVLPPRPKQPRLVSSCGGRIDRILLTIPTYAAAEYAYVYQGLLSQLPSHTRFVIACHEAAMTTVQGWVVTADAKDRAEIFAMPDHLHFSVWAEDGYVVAGDQDSNRTYFVEPFAFPRYADGLIADFAANATDLENTQTPLYFQGGNVLIGDDFFLIGADYPARSLEYLKSHLVRPEGVDPAAFIKSLYNEYLDRDRKLHYVASTIPVPVQQKRPTTIDGQQWDEILFMGNAPGTSQPLFHIDMFITLVGRDAGRFQVLVGDPRLAAQTLEEPVSPNAMVEVFDNIAKGMSLLGFEVLRNPLPLVYVDDPDERVRRWYFATSNNCLVQNSKSDGKVVWLPTYGHGSWQKLSSTDLANKRIWEQRGFEVRLLGDFHPFAANLGALHCIKKYLARSE
jgi:hypothetical protein